MVDSCCLRAAATADLGRGGLELETGAEGGGDALGAGGGAEGGGAGGGGATCPAYGRPGASGRGNMGFMEGVIIGGLMPIIANGLSMTIENPII